MKISIVIPSYNRAKILPRAIASIPKDAELGGHHVQIIIVDGDSPDGTADVVARLQKDDPRIEFFLEKPNRNMNNARNIGIAHATGEWISFLDSDDEYALGGLQAALATIQDLPPEIEVAGFMTMREVEGVMKSRGYRVGESWDIYDPTYEDVILKNNIQGDIHYCIRREVFGRGFAFPGDIHGFESFFFADMAKRGVHFRYFNQLVDLRHTDGSNLSGMQYNGKRLRSAPERWPRHYARYYRAYGKEHEAVLVRHPKEQYGLMRALAGCYLRAWDPRGLWWLMSALLLKLRMKFLPAQK